MGAKSQAEKQTEMNWFFFFVTQVTTGNAKDVDKQKLQSNLELAKVEIFSLKNQFRFLLPLVVLNEAIPTWCILIVSGTYFWIIYSI